MSDRGKLSNYNDLIKIGIGGMSNVYRATHPFLNRKVVIKELNEKLAEDRVLLERFSREAIILASMYHQNIVHVYDFWVTKKNRYIVMEYIDGLDLNKTIEDLGALPPSIVLNIGVQILDALNYAHKKGIIHRDIKPHNVMISVNGEAKLMDFGIVIKDEDKSLTKPGTIIGTPNYMSPEQVVGDKLDFRSDIFSFGVMMYEMLTGLIPFEEGPDGSVFTKIRTFKHISVKNINKKVPGVLCKIVDKCLKKDATKRYKSSLELLKIMQKLLEKELKGLDVNEHLMKFLLENDLYKGESREKIKGIEITADFTQKVTKIVQEREEEFNAWRRSEFFRKLTIRLVILSILGLFALGGYYFSERYFSGRPAVVIIKEGLRPFEEHLGITKPSRGKPPKRPVKSPPTRIKRKRSN